MCELLCGTNGATFAEPGTLLPAAVDGVFRRNRQRARDGVASGGFVRLAEVSKLATGGDGTGSLDDFARAAVGASITNAPTFVGSSIGSTAGSGDGFGHIGISAAWGLTDDRALTELNSVTVIRTRNWHRFRIIQNHYCPVERFAVPCKPQ